MSLNARVLYLSGTTLRDFNGLAQWAWVSQPLCIFKTCKDRFRELCSLIECIYALSAFSSVTCRTFAFTFEGFFPRCCPHAAWSSELKHWLTILLVSNHSQSGGLALLAHAHIFLFFFSDNRS